jgi:lipopolysaccharide transport system ATP-binding protein
VPSMQNEVVIQVENLGKSYLIGHEVRNGRGQESFREAVGRQAKGIVGAALDICRGRQIIQGNKIEEFWALDDVSFEVKRGEVLGIIGRNGAGKSTLLKILSRITEPTRGRATIRGRAASLLEVGTGFHQDLTGRENIFLNGAILGMSRAEIKSKFDEIVDFAEVDKFLDTPVKRYSSGMYVRLAFAVAAHLEPEILIIDEVLAVGDVVFQKKCLGKMRTAANSGRTVLFVSHNMQTVAGLTERAILLQSGRVAAMGRSAEIIEEYLASHTADDPVYRKVACGTEPEITRVEVHTSRPGQLQQFGKPMTIEIEIHTLEPVPNSNVSFQILTASNQPVLHVLNLDSELPMLRSPGTHKLSCLFPRLRLYPGLYHFNFYMGASEPRRVFRAPHQVCPFEVAVLDEVRDFYWAPHSALYVEDVKWSSELLKHDQALSMGAERFPPLQIQE